MNFIRKLKRGRSEQQPKKDDFELWKMRRKRMLYLMALQQLMNGIEYSITYATMWQYIKYVNSNKPENSSIVSGESDLFADSSDSQNRIFYSLISTSKFLSTILFSPLVGKIMDKYRCLTLLTLIANVLALIGNLVYTFNFSIWWLLIGAFLTGIQGIIDVLYSFFFK